MKLKRIQVRDNASKKLGIVSSLIIGLEDSDGKTQRCVVEFTKGARQLDVVKKLVDLSNQVLEV